MAEGTRWSFVKTRRLAGWMPLCFSFCQAFVEGIVVGGGITLLRLATKVDAIKNIMENEEEKVGADIIKRALSYPLKLIAKNAGVNGSVVSEKVSMLGVGSNKTMEEEIVD